LQENAATSAVPGNDEPAAGQGTHTRLVLFTRRGAIDAERIT